MHGGPQTGIDQATGETVVLPEGGVVREDQYNPAAIAALAEAAINKAKAEAPVIYADRAAAVAASAAKTAATHVEAMAISDKAPKGKTEDALTLIRGYVDNDVLSNS